MAARLLLTDAERRAAGDRVKEYYEGMYPGAVITIARVYDTTFDNGFPMCDLIVSRNCRPV